MAGPALARLYAGRACPALLHATPRAGGRLDADHKALGSAVQEGRLGAPLRVGTVHGDGHLLHG